MSIFNKIWKKTIFTRLLALFLLIMTPIYVIAYGIYNWGIHSILDEITNSVKSQGSFYLESLKKEIQRIKTLQYSFLYDEDLSRLVLIPESLNDLERTKTILRLYKKILVFNNSSNYIDNVYIHIPSINKTIYAQGTIREMVQEEYRILLTSMAGSNSQIVYWQNKILLTAIGPSTNKQGNEKPAFIVEVELSGKELDGALQQFNHKEGASFLINSRDGLRVSSTGNESTINEFSALNNQFRNMSSGTKAVIVDGKWYIAIFQADEYLGLALIRYIPEAKVFTVVNTYHVWFWIFCTVSLVIIVLFSFSLYRMIHKPLIKLVTSFKKVETGDFNIIIESRHDNEFGYIYQRFNDMVAKVRILIDQVITEKTLLHKAELKQLQSQINPHLLYNCLFTLNSIAYAEGGDMTAKFAAQLGEYFKFITRDNADNVSLSRELEHARIYTDIQMVRFFNRIQVQFDELPECYAGIQVPKLIVQPVLENSFKYGLENVKQGGRIHVSFKTATDCLSIFIEDNGPGMDEDVYLKLQNILNSTENEYETTGIINIHRRLQLKFGSDSGILISRGSMGGVKAELRIMFKKE